MSPLIQPKKAVGQFLSVVFRQTFPHSIVKKRDLALEKWVNDQKQSDAYAGRGEERNGTVPFAPEKKKQQKEDDRSAHIPSASDQAYAKSHFLFDRFI